MKDKKQHNIVSSSNDRFRKGLWSSEEDKMLLDYVNTHGKGHWNSVNKKTDLKRSGKSCRLRWMNYLSPTVKRDRFSEDEEDLIIRLHNLLGNRWALIAGRVPGRTDNQVKNHWNTHLSKKTLSANESSHMKPGANYNDKFKSCCSRSNLCNSVNESEIRSMISSDFSCSNTVYGAKSSSGIPKETAGGEEAEEETTVKMSDQQKARDEGGDEVLTEEAAGDRDGGEQGGGCLMQYLDDYTLQFVLSGTQKNVAAAGV